MYSKTAVLAFAGAVIAQSSSSTVAPYSNPMTAYTSLTDSRGVVTGQPTANMNVNTNVNTNVVTSQPTPNLSVVTSQPTLVTVPAGMGSSSSASTTSYPSVASSMAPMGVGASSVAAGGYPVAGTPGSPAGTPTGTPVGTPVNTPASTPSSSSSSGSSSSTGSSSGSRSSSSASASAKPTSGAAAVQVSGGMLSAVGLIFAAFL